MAWISLWSYEGAYLRRVLRLWTYIYLTYFFYKQKENSSRKEKINKKKIKLTDWDRRPSAPPRIRTKGPDGEAFLTKARSSFWGL